VEFVSEGSEYTNSAGLGYVALGTQYNSYAPPYNDKRTMLNAQFSDAAKPSRSFSHWVECKPEALPMDEMYVRSGAVPSGADKRMYDLGVLTLAVGGNTVNSAVIGELWVTYDVLFHLPKTADATGENNQYFGASAALYSNASPINTLNTWDTPSTSNTFNMTKAGSVITFPNSLRGLFQIRCTWLGAGAVVIINPSMTISGPGVFSGGAILYPPNGTTASQILNMNTILISGDGVSITFGAAGTLPGGTNVMGIQINQIPQPPSETAPIFDVKGKNRQLKYDKFFKRFEEDNDEDWVVLKETKLFGLEENLSTHDYCIYAVEEDDEFPISKDFAERMRTLSDEIFDIAAQDYIMSVVAV